ncbi:MAG TPA: hypothetical protein VF556_05380 [Pyrinomonadaceae bacterium]
MFIPLFLILGLAVPFILGKNPDKEDAEFQINIFYIAFCLRVLFGFILYGWDLGELFGDEDASGYIIGWQVAENWYKNGLDGFFPDIYKVLFGTQNIGQTVIWGAVMFIFGGASRMIASVINSFAGAVLVIVVYRLAKKLFDFQTAKITALLMTFWLSFILLSAGTSKEMLVICLEWSLLYVAVRNQKGLTQKDIILSALLMLVLYTLRFYAFYICAGALFVRAIIADKKYFARNSILGIILVSSLLFFLDANGVVNRDFSGLDAQNSQVDAWRTTVAKTTGSGTNVMSEYRGSILLIPVATLYFFFAPFPWQVIGGNMRTSFAAIENIVLIIFFVIGFPAIKIFFKERIYQVAPVLAFCVVYAGFQIWGLSNLGLAWRHKQTVMPLLFMLLALSITKNFRKNLPAARR